MRIWIMTFLFILSTQAWALGNTRSEIAQRCSVTQNQSAPLYSSDFKWGYNLPELLEKFSEIYQSPKRLPQKAYWNQQEQKIKLPSRPFWGGEIEIHPQFIQTVARHIEQAFSLNVIDGVFFPDMGHSHLLIPQKLYDKEYADFPVSEFKSFYEKLFQDPSLRVLYHTAEQLQMIDQNNDVLLDPRIKMRHETRNIVGDNHPQSELQFYQNPESVVNTVHQVPGYYWWGGGFNISANENGCFSFQKNGETFYFDLSLLDLEPAPDSAEWDQALNF